MPISFTFIPFTATVVKDAPAVIPPHINPSQAPSIAPVTAAFPAPLTAPMAALVAAILSNATKTGAAAPPVAAVAITPTSIAAAPIAIFAQLGETSCR